MDNQLNKNCSKYLFSSGEVQACQEQDDALIVTALLCKAGTFNDSKGAEVSLSKAQLHDLVNTYNQEVEAEYKKILAKQKEPIGRIFLEKLLGKKSQQLSIDEVTLAPVTTEHTLHNSFVVGRVIGRLEFRNISAAYAEVWGKLFISTREYVDKVKGGILNQISIAFYPETNRLDEVSFTVYGAIDGAQIIRMSQNGFKPDKTMLAKTIGELSKKLALVDSELNEIDSKLSNIRNKQSLERSVLSLVHWGKIYPRDKDLLMASLKNMSSQLDRDILLSTIKQLPNAIDLRVYNKNKQAFKMEELVMTTDKTVLVQTAEEISNAVQDSLKQESIRLSKANQTNADNNNCGVDLADGLANDIHALSGAGNNLSKCSNKDDNSKANTNQSLPEFSREHGTVACDLLKQGKNDEALNYLQKFTGEAIAGEEIQQTALSAEDKSTERQLEVKKNDKEELKLSLLNQIGKLTDILQKIP